MARIKIEGKDMICPFPYKLTTISFAFCTSPGNGGKQINLFVSCKAFLHDTVRQFLHKGQAQANVYGYEYKNDPPIDMDKLRLLVAKDFIPPWQSKYGPGEFRRNLFAAKKIINFYEKEAGWTKSRVDRVDMDNHKHVWLFTGSKRWMSAPQLISMYTLILRACVKNGPIKFKTNKDIEKAYKRWVDRKITDYPDLLPCWDKMFLVVKHYDELFGKMGLDTLYPRKLKMGESFHTNGIATLSQFQSLTKKLNRKLKKICKREGVSTEKRRMKI